MRHKWTNFRNSNVFLAFHLALRFSLRKTTLAIKLSDSLFLVTSRKILAKDFYIIATYTS